jgi:LPXTG-site transpeptidase (sortase) family protein
VTNPAGEDDLFGRSVALSRGWFVAGASGRDSGSRTRAGEAFLNLLGAVQLPSTGFAPGVETLLPAQPGELAYADEGGMTLEIPALGESLSVVGVPKSGSGWDVRWLGGEAGYLEGTAFPTWQGNSALAAHATLANGQPGPFAGLEKLRWGDRVVVRAWGQDYVYEVRQNSLVVPGDVGVLRHEELSWLTLVTCQGFDEHSNAFRWRRVVRAVLVEVTN